MDLAHASTGRLRITPQKHLDESLDVAPEPMPDPQAPLPELGSLFNWCVLDVCRSILKAGKIFGREGLLGPYRYDITPAVLLAIALTLTWLDTSSSFSCRESSYSFVSLVGNRCIIAGTRSSVYWMRMSARDISPLNICRKVNMIQMHHLWPGAIRTDWSRTTMKKTHYS